MRQIWSMGHRLSAADLNSYVIVHSMGTPKYSEQIPNW